MTDTTAILGLPYLLPSQAQKHVTHNEALRILDAVTQLSVLSADLDTPPTAPATGDRHIVASPGQDDWAGQDHAVAIRVDEAWQFFAPQTGWRADVAPTGESLRFDGSGWQVADQPEELPLLGLNTSADATNRLAVASAATLLTHAGAGHQLKINKNADTDTASLLFQTNWSGRAEMGTAGSDGFAIKVSPDGSGFLTALSVDPASAAATLKKRFFSVSRTTSQTGVPDNSHTVVLFDQVQDDDAGMFDTGTARLTPPAGAVSAIAGTYATGLTPGTICTLGVRKNGALLSQKIYYAAAGGDIGMDVALQDTCSGSDTYEIVVFIRTTATGALNSNPANTYFRGFHH